MLAERVAVAAEELLSAVDAACGASVSESGMVEVLRGYGAVKDRLDAAAVGLIAGMVRRGVFSMHGYTRPEYAVADLLGWDRGSARRRVRLAGQVCPRVGLAGQERPAVLAHHPGSGVCVSGM